MAAVIDSSDTPGMTVTLVPPAVLAGEGLPLFEAITPDEIQAHIPELLHQLENELTALEQHLAEALAQGSPLDWHGVMDPLHRLGERLRWSWGVVGHLNGVSNSPELREAHGSQQAAVVAFGQRCGQSQVIYQVLRALREQGGWDGTQQRILDAEVREMELRGVGLGGEAKESFNAASQELAELATRFGNQLLDATSAWSLTLTTAEEVEGLPMSLLEQLAQAARQADVRAADGRPASAETGPWLMGLDMPRFAPFMQYSRRRDLREQVYRAHVSRASGEEGGNWPLIHRILELRRQQAQRLGYANWAEVS
ncbi:MAG: M3 family peptidase, partial [Cyanobacteriota bacterium]